MDEKKLKKIFLEESQKKQTWRKINIAEWPEIKNAKFTLTWAPKMYGATVKINNNKTSVLYDGFTKEYFILI